MNILGNLGSITKSVMRAREKQAELSVHAYLSRFDDASLANLGVDRKKLKRGGHINYFV